MRNLPILFSAPMVRATLREIEQPGTGKTQTRRVLLPLPRRTIFFDPKTAGPDQFQPPRYAIGDLLYVREGWHAARSLDNTSPRDIPRDADIEYAATARSYAEIGLKGKLRPGMFLPRWASRITLIVTDVRVQRLQAISYADVEAEGIVPPSGSAFSTLWDTLNAKRGCGWDMNPWVAAYTVKPILGNIDTIAEQGEQPT